MSEFQQLIDDRDLIVGFNSKKFDNSLCEANGIKIDHKPHYDILVQIARAVHPHTEKPYFKDCGLSNCCKANFNTQKSGDGALAPVQWQNGEIGSVIDYCINDVRLTKKLFDKIMQGHPIVSPKDGKTLLTIEKADI